MEISDIYVKQFAKGSFHHSANEGIKHIKELPYLSVVQATEGYYSFGFNGESVSDTEEGGCFIAPASGRQEIIHHVNRESGVMSARWIFLEVLINKTGSIDTFFSFPLIPKKALSLEIGNSMNEIFATEDCCDTMISCYKLIKILLNNAEERPKMHSHTAKAISYITANYKKHITVSEIAESMHISPSRLYAVFSADMGSSPIQYLNHYRLSRSCFLLENTSDRISKVAEEAGFSDCFYFSKLFKNKYQISPSCYRKEFMRAHRGDGPARTSTDYKM